MLRIEEDNHLQVTLDREICSGQRKIDSVDYNYKIMRTVDNDGLVVSLYSFDDSNDVESSLEIDPEKTLVLQVSDAELELLLAHQPGLFLRSLRKWSSQRAICDWLVTRLRVEVEIDDEKNVTRQLTVDRTVPVPRNVEKGEIGGPGAGGPGYQLRARQLNNDIILEALPKGNGDVNNDDDNNNPSKQQERPMSRVKIGLAEFQSLGAPENVPEQEQFPLKPKTPGMKPKTPGTASNDTMFDLGRPARTPLDSLLSRLSWSMKNGQPVLGINRVVYEETKAIKGTPLLLRASVMEKDIIFQATRLKLKDVKSTINEEKDDNEEDNEDKDNEVDDMYEKVGEEMVRLITESEAAKLLSLNIPNDETGPIPQTKIDYLLQPSNRRELCSILSDRLKLIKIGGVWRLETFMHREKSLLTIAVDSNHRDAVIGAVDIDDQMSLFEVRKLIEKEMDEDDLPTSWRFL